MLKEKKVNIRWTHQRYESTRFTNKYLSFIYPSTHHPNTKKMFYYHSTGLEDASQIMPSSGLGISKEMLFPEMDKTENKSNKKSSPRSSKVIDLNKVGISPKTIWYHYQCASSSPMCKVRYRRFIKISTSWSVMPEPNVGGGETYNNPDTDRNYATPTKKTNVLKDIMLKTLSNSCTL